MAAAAAGTRHAPFLHHPRAQRGCCWTDTSPSPTVPPSVCPQVPVMLEEVTVSFSAEEWALLEEWQRELHREVTAATAQLLASLGRAGAWRSCRGGTPAHPGHPAAVRGTGQSWGGCARMEVRPGMAGYSTAWHGTASWHSVVSPWQNMA
uniref:KRAB domain-containing protein n=1 Tax=Pavo cristatus TaxID=9049 RepID=A0A8C9FHN4_PAVCR